MPWKACCSLFIDGTVAGTPADLTAYIDKNVTHDHAYYGRGCRNGWGTDGDGGSITPCADSDAGGRYVKTADNETQKNGTYYNFQAASTGSGGAITTDNTNSPDTFCPLGWQLPYSGTGGDYYDKSRSWRYLFTKYDISFNDSTAADATKVKSYPFSYVYSGFYYWITGRLFFQSSDGFYWSSTVVNGTGTYALRTWSLVVRPAYTGGKADGDTVRCIHHFIDGTVEGTSIVPYQDNNAEHDHTYYGNGCTGEAGDSASSKSCTSHIVQTKDGETQSIGTYYGFQASTAGAGATATDDNINISDTFCPLGWQLPYSGKGGDYDDKSRSWNHLFKSYGLHIGDGTATDATKVKSYPFSYVYSGYYDWYAGRLYYQSDSGFYWSSTVVSSTNAYGLATWSSVVRPAHTNRRAFGGAVRCVL